MREFQLKTGVRSIVRAHMMQPEGFEVLGNHEVVTVFSAVNYKDSGALSGMCGQRLAGQHALNLEKGKNRSCPPAGALRLLLLVFLEGPWNVGGARCVHHGVVIVLASFPAWPPPRKLCCSKVLPLDAVIARLDFKFGPL